MSMADRAENATVNSFVPLAWRRAFQSQVLQAAADPEVGSSIPST